MADSPASTKPTVSIVGASGYTGGEVLRLLLGHPNVQIKQVTSESNAGSYVYTLHPNLRKVTSLQFVSAVALEPVDVLFLALPHGEAQKRIEAYSKLATTIIDLSADFRLRDLALYERYYGEPHAAPAWVDKFVYGLPKRDWSQQIQKSDVDVPVECQEYNGKVSWMPIERCC